MRQKRAVSLAIVVLPALAVGGALLTAALIRLVLPRSGTVRFWNGEDYVQPETAADRAALLDAEVLATASLIELFGSMILILTIAAAIYSANQARKTLEHSRKELQVAQNFNQQQLRITQEGQITDRFFKAIEQLGARRSDDEPNIEARLGGIYALERIAQDSCFGDSSSPDWCRDHWPTMEFLMSYVRDNATSESSPIVESGERPRPRTDIQSILSVIGRRNTFQRQFDSERKNKIELPQAFLQGANLRNTFLQGAELQKADLQQAELVNAQLRWAVFWKAKLMRTDFTGAGLQIANLEETNLRGALFIEAEMHDADLCRAEMQESILYEAKMQRATLWHANLEGAELQGADLSHAQLQWASFHRTNLKGARLHGANLRDTRLEGVDLSDVVGLSQWQLDDGAILDEKTRLPDGECLHRPVGMPDCSELGSDFSARGRKVSALITRADRLLLVSSPGPNGPELQLPCFSIGPFETPLTATFRGGRSLLDAATFEAVEYLGSHWIESRDDRGCDYSQRFFFQLVCDGGLPDDRELELAADGNSSRTDVEQNQFTWWKLESGFPDVVDEETKCFLDSRLSRL